ncbi:hypothetical protein, partial [Bacteroides heparinolyticus]|uniref:hypothetical protein n=1 Tax=Prevotella heparinolytica TaxID=28113 RepID=UPI00359F3D15
DGLDYAGTLSLVGQSTLNTLDGPYWSIPGALDIIRQKIGSQGLMTSYLYEPLVGMTKQTLCIILQGKRNTEISYLNSIQIDRHIHGAGGQIRGKTCKLAEDRRSGRRGNYRIDQCTRGLCGGSQAGK